MGPTISLLSSPSPVTPGLHRGNLGPSRTSAMTTGRDTHQEQRGNLPTPLYQPPALLGKKSSGRSSAMPEDTTSPVVMSDSITALFPKLCDPSSRREISAALMTLLTLPSSCWTGTCSDRSARKRKTIGGPCWNPPTALPIPNATGPYCATWEARGRIPSKCFNCFRWKNQLQPEGDRMRAFNRQFTACSVQQDRAIRRLLSNLHRHPRVDPSYRPFDVRGVAVTIRKTSSSTAQGPDGLTMIHLHHLGPHGLAFLVELFNLSVAGINIPVIWGARTYNAIVRPILNYADHIWFT